MYEIFGLKPLVNMLGLLPKGFLPAITWCLLDRKLHKLKRIIRCLKSFECPGFSKVGILSLKWPHNLVGVYHVSGVYTHPYTTHETHY